MERIVETLRARHALAKDSLEDVAVQRGTH
jgi:hypothetical protein